MLESWNTFQQQVGWVLWPLIAVAITLWYALVHRLLLVWTTRYGRDAHKLAGALMDAKQVPLINAVDKNHEQIFKQRVHYRKHLDQAFYTHEAELLTHKALINTLILVAPLLGLLGTVGGMIETFDALQSMDMYAQTGGIAGGISQALLTTQIGLIIAIPGYLLNGFIERKSSVVRANIAQIKSLLTVKVEEKLCAS